jgi:indolepyruvate ferredoxin oxidoreductase, beta subunit
MTEEKLRHDPYNILVAGVGGQGNLLTSRLIGLMLMKKNYKVTIAESFGATQRGGSVNSQLRASAIESCSPGIPANSAHLIIGLEPLETLRQIEKYGNPKVKIVCNSRAIPPSSVMTGARKYPDLEAITQWLGALSAKAWLFDATTEAMKLGKVVYANIVMIGAMVGTGDLPIDRYDFEAAIEGVLPPGEIENNFKAFDMGMSICLSDDATCRYFGT